jgi:hypothetical protein
MLLVPDSGQLQTRAGALVRASAFLEYISGDVEGVVL